VESLGHVDVEPDITDLVMRHHAELRRLLRRLSRDGVTVAAVQEVLRTLQAHERAKSETLYELADGWIDGGSEVAAAQRARASVLLDGAARLHASARRSGRGAGGTGLLSAFADHARVDEHSVIAPLRHRCPRDELVRAASRYDSLVGPPLSSSSDLTC
jgi:DNA-binding transcriptional MerR regulator